MISKNKIEFRRDFLSSLLSNFTRLLGLGLSLVFITHIIFFGEEYSVSIAQILQGLSGFTLLYLSSRGITKKAFDSLLKEKKILLKVFILPFIAIISILIYKINLNNLDGYIRRMGEGSLVEWLSFLLFLLSSFLIFRASNNDLNKQERIILKIGSIILFIFSMEEISWGQMIFNWGSPTLMNKFNIQNETNLHNIMFIHDKSWVILFCIFSISLILSLIGFYLRCNQKIKIGSTSDIIFPLGCCSSYFAIASFIYLGVILLKSGFLVTFLHTREQEMGELFFAIGVFIHSSYIFTNCERTYNNIFKNE